MNLKLLDVTALATMDFEANRNNSRATRD